jgi:hypothetical protein
MQQDAEDLEQENAEMEVSFTVLKFAILTQTDCC